MPDDLLIRVADLNTVTGGLLSKLLTARLFAIGYEIDPYVDAVAFYQSLAVIVDQAAARVNRKRLN